MLEYLFIAALQDIAGGDTTEPEEGVEIAPRVLLASFTAQLNCCGDGFPYMVPSSWVAEVVQGGARGCLGRLRGNNYCHTLASLNLQDEPYMAL